MRLSMLLAVGGLAASLSVSALAHEGEKDEQKARPNLSTVPELTTPAPKASAPADVDPEKERKAQAYFTDTPLVSHEGKKLRFFSDVLKGKVVLVTFFYTDCTGICPLTSAKLARVQELLGDRIGRDVYLVSISVDPETDTPEVMAKYRENFGAKDGWIFLSGERENVAAIGRKLGQVFSKESHLPTMLLGNLRTAHWQKVNPNVPAELIAARLQMLASGVLSN